MLEPIEADELGAIAVQHGAGGDHLRVEKRMARHEAMEEPAMPVGPFHHRRNTESMSLIWLHFNRSPKSLTRLVCTRFYAMTRQISPLFDASVHTERTRRGDLYQAQIWLVARPGATEGKVCHDTFLRRKDAEEWALEIERRIDRGEPTLATSCPELRKFGDLVCLHCDDLRDVGKRIGRSKNASLAFLERKLGSLHLQALDRDRLINFGKERAREGAGPVTLSMDLRYIKTILSHAAAVHGVLLSTKSVDLARIALGRLGLVGKGLERDQRPTQDELDRVIATFEGNIRQQIPLGRIIRFAVATAMRQDEICRVAWSDFDAPNKMLLIRDREDPRRKNGNNRRIPLLGVSGYDACALIEEQGAAFSHVAPAESFHTMADQ
jgi:hypothetical protein